MKRTLTRGVILLIVGGVILGGSLAAARLIDHVDSLILSDRPGATLQFTDLPESLLSLAASDLQASLADLRKKRWIDADLCESMAKRLSASAWVRAVRSVRRTGDGRFEVSAIYRAPVAAIQNGDEFYLVDAEGVRLPGAYTFNPTWKLIRGVAAPAPNAGSQWAGDDLQAGLRVIRLIASEPYESQIKGVLVENCGGRTDPRGSHVELLTDRQGGRIRWGSAPGRELEENSIPQKLSLLRQNFSATGRADANRLVIDISTFPDRFLVCTELG